MTWTEFSFILQPSSLGGVGVFAVHDIIIATPVLTGEFNARKMHPKDIPAGYIKYCIFITDEECLCPQRFDRMEIGWYINHSDEPNIAKAGSELVAVRVIKAGDEILFDYNQLNEPEHLKDAFYRK